MSAESKFTGQENSMEEEKEVGAEFQTSGNPLPEGKQCCMRDAQDIEHCCSHYTCTAINTVYTKTSSGGS